MVANARCTMLPAFLASRSGPLGQAALGQETRNWATLHELAMFSPAERADGTGNVFAGGARGLKNPKLGYAPRTMAGRTRGQETQNGFTRHELAMFSAAERAERKPKLGYAARAGKVFAAGARGQETRKIGCAPRAGNVFAGGARGQECRNWATFSPAERVDSKPRNWVTLHSGNVLAGGGRGLGYAPRIGNVFAGGVRTGKPKRGQCSTNWQCFRRRSARTGTPKLGSASRTGNVFAGGVREQETQNWGYAPRTGNVSLAERVDRKPETGAPAANWQWFRRPSARAGYPKLGYAPQQCFH